MIQEFCALSDTFSRALAFRSAQVAGLEGAKPGKRLFDPAFRPNERRLAETGGLYGVSAMAPCSAKE